jgi:hypothetical protein
MTDEPEVTEAPSAESGEAPCLDAKTTWVGTKPTGVECVKKTGICGYLNCKSEDRCLHVVS